MGGMALGSRRGYQGSTIQFMRLRAEPPLAAVSKHPAGSTGPTTTPSGGVFMVWRPVCVRFSLLHMCACACVCVGVFVPRLGSISLLESQRWVLAVVGVGTRSLTAGVPCSHCLVSALTGL